MARRKAPLQVNSFAGGLNTEFPFLEAPPNVTSDELNMEIDRRGSRVKRLGFDLEDNFKERSAGIPYVPSKRLGRTTFKWDNVGGDSNKSLLAVQIGNHFAIYDIDSPVSISDFRIYTETFPPSTYESSYSFSTIEGSLVMVNGDKEVNIYKYENGYITKTTDILKIRDLFGVVAVEGGKDLTTQSDIQSRPVTARNHHIYNLRNQTFGVPRPINDGGAIGDPIQSFFDSFPANGPFAMPGSGNGRYPSNADNLLQFFYANANSSSNKTLEKYYPGDNTKTSPGSSQAPTGYFVIDAMDRGASRYAEVVNLQSKNSALTKLVTGIDPDRTPGGASVITEYSGRVWYGGFSAKLEGGDRRSPRMSSYLLFSALVKDETDITRCYQRADPTSFEESDLVDTDGGFLRIEGAYGINKLIAVQRSLFVFAENGVWKVSGGGGDPFKATSYEVELISDKGCISGKSVVMFNSSLFYWGEGGIYYIAQNEFAEWKVENLTQSTIQEFYLNIGNEGVSSVSGYFDSFENKIRWVYTEGLNSEASSKELVLNLNFQAFTINEIANYPDTLPAVIGVFPVNPYRVVNSSNTVTVNGVPVTASGVIVTTSATFRGASTREVGYLVLTQLGSNITYSFGNYSDSNFVDWAKKGTGVPFDAFLLTAFVTGGEGRFTKQVPYLTTFFRKTEDGFDLNLDPTQESSCLVSARWNWTNKGRSGKWSNRRQAYRPSKAYIPSGPTDKYDDGVTVITTRSKIRGMGDSIAFRFDAEHGKDMHIYGWSFDLIANAEE